ncbi:hypothetical protein MN116_008848 [Schistosoma mekongi]|uniref:c-Myc-binding protein n=1 Tax=Schistosoma mekongi TaxID=38744 RepID=A0AAE2D106_SCHME|nr:hypothetical protein MN116_008848 [Schistosoma mekongi]
MSPYKPGNSKREEFRKYLERSGAIDALTKVLVGLYEEPEKPDNALEFMKKHLQAEGPETSDIDTMKVEIAELKQKIETLESENTELKRSINQQLTPATGTNDGNS